MLVFLKRNFLTIYWFTIAFIFFGIALNIGTGTYIDSTQYVANARYLFPQLDNKYTIGDRGPFTLFGPVYGVFVHILIYFTQRYASFFISFYQLLGVLVSSFTMYLILKYYFAKLWGFIGSVIYLLLPFNVIYATMVLSEGLSTFLFSLRMFIFFLYFQRKSHTKVLLSGLLILISTLLVLTRYSFIPIFLFSIVILIYTYIRCLREFLFSRRKSLLVTLVINALVFVCISVYLFSWWVGVNYTLYGIKTLSIIKGKHLFDGVVVRSHILPDPTDPTVIKLMNALDKKRIVVDLWSQNNTYLSYVNNVEDDKLFLDFSLAAIRRHPSTYFLSTFIASFSLPLYEPMYADETLLCVTSCNKECGVCRISPYLCKSLVNVCPIKSSFARYVDVNHKMYPWVGFGLLTLFLIGNFYFVFRQSSLFLKFIVMLFSIMLFFQIALEHLDGRYLLILYPLYTVGIVGGIKYSTHTFGKWFSMVIFSK